MADANSIEQATNIIVEVIPRAPGAQITSSDARSLLNQVANFYPETSHVMDAVNRLIIRLETLRHEAILPLTLGNTEDALQLLKQAAKVEVCHV